MRWRKRIGEEGVEWLLTETIEAAKRSGTIKAASLSTIVVDTTVQLKAIAHPTDSRLLNRAREQLVDEAKAKGIELRQSYARIGPRAELQAGRYAHAKQYRRMRGQLRKLRGWLGRVGLSEFLCARHTMTARSQYAETEEAGAAGKHP